MINIFHLKLEIWTIRIGLKPFHFLLHRYKAICDSLRHRAKSWKYIVYVICISCFQNVRKFFEFDVYPDPEHPFKNKTRYLWQEDLLNNQKYIRFVETEDILMLAVLPIALLIFFNGNIWLQIRYENNEVTYSFNHL